MIVESKPCKFGLTDSREEDEGTSVHMKYSAEARGDEGGNDGIWYRAQGRENKVEKFHLVRRTGFACWKSERGMKKKRTKRKRKKKVQRGGWLGIPNTPSWFAREYERARFTGQKRDVWQPSTRLKSSVLNSGANNGKERESLFFQLNCMKRFCSFDLKDCGNWKNI